MNVIGIGSACCKVTKLFEEFPQYKTYFVDTQNKDNYENFFKIQEQAGHEDYEKNYKQLNLKKIKGETTIVLCGSGKISGIILRFLRQIKDKKISIIYIKPDMITTSRDAKLREKVVFGVLQEYARSNLLSKFFIFSNSSIESIIEDISISSYWDDINNIICNTYHMLNIFENT